MKHDFSLAKNRIGIYINLPDFSWSCQVQAGDKPSEKTLRAIKAVFDAFHAAENEPQPTGANAVALPAIQEEKR